MEKNRDLKRERDEIQADIERVTKKRFVASDRIMLDIGGQIFKTTTLTLGRCPDSLLASIANGH